MHKQTYSYIENYGHNTWSIAATPLLKCEPCMASFVSAFTFIFLCKPFKVYCRFTFMLIFTASASQLNQKRLSNKQINKSPASKDQCDIRTVTPVQRGFPGHPERCGFGSQEKHGGEGGAGRSLGRSDFIDMLRLLLCLAVVHIGEAHFMSVASRPIV